MGGDIGSGISRRVADDGNDSLHGDRSNDLGDDSLGYGQGDYAVTMWSASSA